ncbi:MAG TPA: UDP-N-acetylmuramoyl-L-alanyl-D-glutamate--2,6-diaminopimelate ligase [Vicinamibacterales bacterium]|nr:UDP-N-acetylmuramoyl-L-alanyl-D-glutamate--2,6-diaminopimelate ligase [Vicinamibacterales bacterium]
MTLEQLRDELDRAGLAPQATAWPPDAAARALAGVTHDSRQVASGGAFFALKGQQADGTAFARQAVARGAAVVVAESERLPGLAVPWLVVPDARRALALAAAAHYRHPSREMQVVGITGTNGKTTTAYLLASIFDAAGLRCGVLGTVVYRIGDEEREATRTTPEAPEIQGLLRAMVDRGCGACAIEVSSHALALRRTDGVRFAAAVFTNLTRDHLDFHRDMESYFAAKRRLFEMLEPDAPAVINVDDPRGPALAAAVGRPVTYAIRQPADITPGPLSFSLDGLAFDVRTPRGRLRIRSPLVGRPNVANILAAAGVATALGLPFDAIERGVAALDGVPGRFQVVSGPADAITVVIDYAHTDDALRNLLETARPLARGRLITVFGCGGNRDRTKRPLMGAVAARLSDLVVVTSDNPRHEDPEEIIREIGRGLTPDTTRDDGSAPQHLAITDRRAAIARAIELARAGDLVLIAGKGHEKYQVVGDRVLPFDDAAVAREALARRRTNSGVR